MRILAILCLVALAPFPCRAEEGWVCVEQMHLIPYSPDANSTCRDDTGFVCSLGKQPVLLQIHGSYLLEGADAAWVKAHPEDESRIERYSRIIVADTAREIIALDEYDAASSQQSDPAVNTIIIDKSTLRYTDTFESGSGLVTSDKGTCVAY